MWRFLVGELQPPGNKYGGPTSGVPVPTGSGYRPLSPPEPAQRSGPPRSAPTHQRTPSQRERPGGWRSLSAAPLLRTRGYVEAARNISSQSIRSDHCQTVSSGTCASDKAVQKAKAVKSIVIDSI